MGVPDAGACRARSGSTASSGGDVGSEPRGRFDPDADLVESLTGATLLVPG